VINYDQEILELYSGNLAGGINRISCKILESEYWVRPHFSPRTCEPHCL